jgi:copper chaperone NosL
MRGIARMQRRRFLATLLAILARPVEGAEPPYPPVKPTTRDKCPVCGMFVAKYPDFLAQVIYRDQAYAVFDGAKDLFRYLMNLKLYAPTRLPADIAILYVTDYYALLPIEGKGAWYVIGSDVYGPMGRELIPFAKEPEAKEFFTDHKGKRLLRFAEVTAAVLKELD